MTGLDGKAGMTAKFWNNTDMDGQPVYEGYYSSHPQFDTGGNTVFAPGVELKDFLSGSTETLRLTRLRRCV